MKKIAVKLAIGLCLISYVTINKAKSEPKKENKICVEAVTIVHTALVNFYGLYKDETKRQKELKKLIYKLWDNKKVNYKAIIKCKSDFLHMFNASTILNMFVETQEEWGDTFKKLEKLKKEAEKLIGK